MQELELLYKEEDFSIRKLADYFGVARGTICNRMNEYGINSHKLGSHGNNRTYHINEDFFKTWTPESAWLYGWAVGDGCFTNYRLLAFQLSLVDVEVLEKFKYVLDSDHPVYTFKQWSNKYQKYYNVTRVHFSSKCLVSDIRDLSFYDVPISIFNHFVRGFFEAEGSVFWHKYNTSKGGGIRSNIGNNDKDIKDILEFIHFTLKDILNILEGGSLYTSVSSILTFSKYDSVALYYYMYDNCGNNFLKRKKEKFEELINK